MLAAMMNELLHTHRRWVWKVFGSKKSLSLLRVEKCRVKVVWETINCAWLHESTSSYFNITKLQKKYKVPLRCDERTSTCSCEWISESLGNESTRWSVDSRLWWLWWSGIWLMLKRVVDFNSRDFSWEMRENSRQLHNTQFEWVLAASAEQTRK